MEFSSLDISPKIKKGLTRSGLVTMTEIQSRVIPVALEGQDVIGSSQTGTGKTLAFIVPMLQRLVDLRWGAEDRLGGIVLTPTRELALQIFDVLNDAGRYTGLSAGLVMGGLETENEAGRMAGMNILVCTPGRLLQHLQENSCLDTRNVQMVVLDEADKMVEMGFKEDIVDILGYVPERRQVLLFSATPKASTTRILRLPDPRIISVYREEGFPQGLRQYFYMTGIEDKVGRLYMFLEENGKKKGIVFFSTCKEVKFHHLLLTKLKSSARIFCLSGGMTQRQRIDVFKRFVLERSGMLFCTDLGSRGLDFPQVDVVLQYDCPCNVETYVHRVGRTARNSECGESYVYLVHGEEGLLVDIQKKRWTVGDQGGENREESCRDILDGILEGPGVQVRNVDRRVRGLVRTNKELSEYCRKYLQTYEKFLTFSSKRYSSRTIEKVEVLYKYFGVVPDRRDRDDP